jgi:hypothetical protein
MMSDYDRGYLAGQQSRDASECKDTGSSYAEGFWAGWASQAT